MLHISLLDKKMQQVWACYHMFVCVAAVEAEIWDCTSPISAFALNMTQHVLNINANETHFIPTQ